MDMKAKIADYRAAMKRAEILALEVDDARNATPKSPNMDGMPRSGKQTTLDLQIVIIEAAQARFEKAREAALEQLNELEDLIDQLPWELQKVLYFRHIYRLKWSDVADRMHVSESTARRMHNKAIKEMQNEK